MSFFFLIIASFCISSGIFSLGIKNPIHSILLLILMFFFGSVLLLMLNVEFFAFVFLIVYIGAIAVLFLFMVMTLDIKVGIQKKNALKSVFSYRGIIVGILLLNLFIFIQQDYIFISKTFIENIFTHNYVDYSKIIKIETHLEVLGKALYSEFIIPFLFCGFILFISMIGAIVLTVEDVVAKSLKQQDTVIQALRNNSNVIFNYKIIKNLK